MGTESQSGTLQRFSTNETVKLTTPEKSRHNKYHGKRGYITEIIEDELGSITGDPRDSYIYKIKFPNGETFNARDSDLEKAH